MARKKHSPEQIVAILRQIEVEVANHKPTGQWTVCLWTSTASLSLTQA